MTALVVLRTVFLVVVVIGTLVNVLEWQEMHAIHRRLVRSKQNGLKHQAAANLLASAWRRLLVSLSLSVLLGVVLVSPVPPPVPTTTTTTNAPHVAATQTAIARAVIARVCFISIAIVITEWGFAARRGRKKLVMLIAAEIDAEEQAS